MSDYDWQPLDREKHKAQLFSTNGERLTVGIIKELSYFPDKYKPLYTLAQLKAIYMEHSDPTEYTVALRVLGDWDHWQHLCESSGFRPHIEKWRNELEIKLRSEGLLHMRKAALDGNREAAKYLAEYGAEKRGKGRPTKQESEAEKHKRTAAIASVNADAERLGLKVVAGGGG